MTTTLVSDEIALRGARVICEAFEQWTADFRRLTLQAQACFEQRNWLKAQQDSVERLALYGRAVHACVNAIRELLGAQTRDKSVWRAIKAAYLPQVSRRGDVELTETFFSSITRRIFVTVGVDPEVEFVEPLAPVRAVSPRNVTRQFACAGSLVTVIRDILSAYSFAVPYQDIDRDAALAATEIEANVGTTEIEAIELANAVFFRNKGAYFVGCIRTMGGLVPLIIALLNDESSSGVTVDAVLLTEDDVSIVFSFTRSYFFVTTDRPRELVAFLGSIMPRKPIAELYIAIGLNKHAKTELYRDLLRHLATSNDRFEIARGARGMVMIVFTMPSYDVIFKVFRDRFDYPKTTTRQQVVGKYQLVFGHDRAGRLVDAQEFEYLEFARDRFSDALLKELTINAADTVTMGGESVVIRHLYTERRVTPLDLYLQEADEQAARQAVLDYGAAVRDLAATNIFPGDLLLKNFGVTRHGRVVFYDYDELCLLTDCNFRRLPEPGHADEEFSAEAWFYVHDDDMFPEEFMSFLGLRGQLRDVFLSAHGYLFEAGFWVWMQLELRAGRIIDIFPYPAGKRLLREDYRLV